MLHVQEFLREELHDLNREAEGLIGALDDTAMMLIVLDLLTTVYGIKYNVWEEKLVVLNYSQIDSPKFHPITMECRSLVLDFETLSVVSRSFDRFFNYTEDERLLGVQVSDLTAYEKVDGSLIGVFCYKGEWLYRTKSMIKPTAIINNNVEGVTWRQRIAEGLYGCDLKGLHEDFTYIFELTCRENRVVTRYEEEEGKLWLLTTRDNTTGEYFDNPTTKGMFAHRNGFKLPKTYSFNTFAECEVAAKELRNLEEGYVLYDQEGRPVIKLKNPAYVAAHHLRGEGCLTEKRILDLIVMNETAEYLGIFPEDFEAFKPYIAADCALQYELIMLYEKVIAYDKIGITQKDFAILYKDEPYSSIAFGLRKGKTLKECKERLTRQSHHNMILAYTITTTENI